ncbi:MAG: RND transporter [Alphaproteobacteria bacterium]|nr:MAG: RND transporter [Alphaproteobacteria bacterium]
MVTARELLVPALLLALVGCNQPEVRAPEVRPVRTVVVDPKPIEDDRSAIGEISPRQETDIAFRVAGKLVSRLVDVGAVVAAGQLLARLDEQDFLNNQRSARASVDSAEAVLTEAKAAEERQRQLLANGTTTRANYDASLKNLNAAQAQLEAARASYELASDQLRYAELHADFAGVVTAIGAEPGQIVSTGQMVVRLARPDDKDAVFSLPESAFREQPEQLPEIVVSLLSYPDISTVGVLREVSPVADPATRTYKVKVTLKDPPAQMRFGASVVGRLRAETAPVVVLPGSALFDRDGQPAVWRVDPAAGTVSLRPVIVSRYETDRVIIAGGLDKGDIVVTAGVNRLRENQPVRLEAGAGS